MMNGRKPDCSDPDVTSNALCSEVEALGGSYNQISPCFTSTNIEYSFMADDIGWEIEHIPDEDCVYMRVRKDFPRNTVLQPGVFREHNSGMPVDWDKYSTPQETRSRAKNPLVNAVIEMNVGKLRRVQNWT